jgi:hypothetical protein
MPPVSTGFPLISSECLFLVHILVHIGGFGPIFGPCLTSSSPDSEGVGEWRRGSELDFVPRFRYEENTGFPSERQELFALTCHYFSVLFQYFH